MARMLTFKGTPVTSVGRVLKLGISAPDFRVVSQDMKELGLSDFTGKIKVITFFLSLDTPVCDLQIKEFNKRASLLSSDVAILGISRDLPFAQRRFCQENDIKKVAVLSDYKYGSFGINYGVLVKELNLLARGVAIIDKSGILRYFDVVKELTQPPDYESALTSLKDISANPVSPKKDEFPARCKPCEGDTPPLSVSRIEALMPGCKTWQLIDGKKLVKEFKFRDFAEAKYFLDLVSIISEDQAHHPAMALSYSKLKVTFTTHSAEGLTENDFIMAKAVDEASGE